jgi:type I restriction enzyme M protein
MSQNNGKLDVEQKIWDICGILRDDGMHIGTYVEQVTVLLFLKMMDERERFGSQSIEIPEQCQWNTLKDKDGEELLEHYNRVVLPTLGDQDGIVGEIFARVNSQFRTPVNLREAIREIDDIEWSAIDVDVKGTAYEALLQRYAEEAKGAGQYFTPRPAIKAIVKAIDVNHDDKIHDPAAGTGGFLIQAFEHILEKTNEGLDLSREERRELMTENLSGMELVPETRRLGLMNLALHDLQPQNFEVGDSLAPGPHLNRTYDKILTNPPYGGNQQKKRVRDDFLVNTKNPELNFVQHNMSLLKDGGECGIVVPDGVLFQGGQAERVRKALFDDFDVHTILVLPIGAFQPYTNVTTNVIFFEKGSSTDEVWFYDLRTDIEGIKKSNPLTFEQFSDFLGNYESREESDRYYRVSIDEIEEEEYSLNYKKYIEIDNGEDIPEPEELLTELRSLQESMMDNTEQVMEELKQNGGQDD